MSTEANPQESAKRNGPGADSSVTWVVTHHVRPGSEHEFEQWLKGIGVESARFPRRPQSAPAQVVAAAELDGADTG